MDTIPRDLLPSDLLARSHSLNPLGIDELAWSRRDALHVIRLACEAGIGVLGGDVYRQDSGRYVPIYDSWYCERGEEERPGEFCTRSFEKATDYIQSYPESGGSILFTLVLADRGVC